MQPELPSVPEEIQARVILESGDGRLMRISLEGGPAEPLLPELPDGAVALSPAVSPDGERVAFSYFVPEGDAAVFGPFAIGLATVDGQGLRRLAEPGQPQASYSFPAWSADGRWLYFTAFEPRFDDAGTFRGMDVRLLRIAPDGGEPEAVLDDAIFPSLSADGRSLAFMKRDPEDFSVSLWLARPDGEGARPVLAEHGFAALQFPALSPDGQTIVFSADAPLTAAPRWWERLLGVRRAHAHGAPLSLYVLEVQGGEVRALTDWPEDDIAAAWSPDGRWLVYQGGGALVLVDPEAGQAYRGPRTGGRGGLSWVPQGP